MPARHPHEAGLQLAGDPPSFAAYATRPESEWHLAQDAWLAQFSEGKRALPIPGKAGSAESKERANAWKAAIKQHGKAKRMSLAIAGDDAANAALNGEAGYAQQHAQSKKSVAQPEHALHPRPPGPAPVGYTWDPAAGKWLDSNGAERPDATRNKRRVEQRNASEEQTRTHKQKWQLYESHGRHRQRHNPWTLGDASRSGAQIEDDARRWNAHLEAVAAGRPGEFTPVAAAATMRKQPEGEPQPPPVAMLQPPFPAPQRPADLSTIALHYRVGDRIEWYNPHHPDCLQSEPVFGWESGTVLCTYNVCPMARADDAPNPYHTPGVANYTSQAEREFHFGCQRCTVQRPYAVRLDYWEGKGYRGYLGVQSASAVSVRDSRDVSVKREEASTSHLQFESFPNSKASQCARSARGAVQAPPNL